MPRSIHSRQSNRTLVSTAAVRANTRCGSAAARWGSDESVRVIGCAINVTLPKLHGLRLRYCSRSDEQPAAILAKSMLRLGISQLSDWTGSAVDFVAKGLARYCQKNGLAVISRVFEEGSIRLLDEIVELNEYERSQAEAVGPSSKMLLMIDYEQAAMIQIGPTLSYLRSFDERLPAAFFVLMSHNLWRWMRVYDFQDAENYARDQVEVLDEEELKESFYPQVETLRPKCLKKLPSYALGLKLLRQLKLRLKERRARQLLNLVLEMHDQGTGREAAWPYLLRDRLPEIEDYMEDTDDPGPGCLIVFEENDLIEACFSEEMQYIGQNYSIRSTLMLLIDLAQHPESIDTEVKKTFDYLGAMLRSLASASKLIAMIRGIYDEHLRERRLQQRLQVEARPPSVRGE